MASEMMKLTFLVTRKIDLGEVDWRSRSGKPAVAMVIVAAMPDGIAKTDAMKRVIDLARANAGNEGEDAWVNSKVTWIPRFGTDRIYPVRIVFDD